jgi:hypothetical protein
MLATAMTAADPFIQAVDEARRELSRRENREISNAELARRVTNVKRSTLYYHLNAEVERPGGHRVPREIVHALAAVLPISEDELMKAAQIAAGYQVRGSEPGQPDYGFEVARFLDSDDVSEADKAELALRLSEILADHLRRSLPSPRRNGK